MKNKVKGFFKSEKGLNTVEVVIILAIVVGIALIFRDQIGAFVNGLIQSVFKDSNVNFGPDYIKNIPPSTPPASVPPTH